MNDVANSYPSPQPFDTRHGDQSSHDHDQRDGQALQRRADGHPGPLQYGGRVVHNRESSVQAVHYHYEYHACESLSPSSVFN